MEAKTIADFLMGDEVTGFYLLVRADLKSRRDKQGNYLAVDLADASGQITGHVWEHAESVANEAGAGDVVKIQGSVQSYQGRKQIAISRLRKAVEADEVDMTRLVASVGRKAESLWRDFTKLATSVVNPYLRSLLRKFTDDEEFRAAFCRTPGSRDSAHNYIGGVLEHSVNVTKICERVSGLFAEIDTDLLMSAALLHDVGKIAAYKQSPLFEQTDEGRLLNAAVLGDRLIQKKATDISAFPQELMLKLQHIIFSQCEKNNGQTGAIIPMTGEANILHFADQLDCVQNLYSRFKKREQKGEANWGNYLNSIEPYFNF